jgi:hypothetical protein
MRNQLRIILPAALALVSACKPNVGRAPSLVVGPEVLAVRGVPAEAKPGDPVTYDLLVASLDGTVTDPVANWDVCTTPKPPAESNSVAAACVDAPPGDAQGATFSAAVPLDACTLFGPIAPPPQQNQPPSRPRDPDSTGGYYLPVRAVVSGLTSGALTTFALERIACNLVGASALVIQEYNARYQPNANPTIAQLAVLAPDAAPVILTSEPSSLPADAKVALQATFAPASAETYAAFNPDTQVLVDRRESLSLAWFASAGEFEHDRTGRAETDVETTSDNTWTAPSAGEPMLVHLWLVLRDSRGGVDFASYQVTVTP